MTLFLQRLIGIFLALCAAFGLIFTLIALAYLPDWEANVQQEITITLDALDETLIASKAGLKVANDSLQSGAETLEAVESTTRQVAQAVDESAPLIDTLSTLTGDDLPTIINTTQQSLDAAQEAAQTVDLILTALNTVPLINLPTYDPAVPLEKSVADASASLTPLKESFRDIERSITTTGQNIDNIQQELTTVADGLAEIKQTISDAEDVIQQFEDIVDEQQTILANIQTNVDSAIISISWGISLVLLTLTIAMLGVLIQGIEMVNRGRRMRN